MAAKKQREAIDAPASAPLQIEFQPIESLKAYARNSRTHSESQLAQIRASMREWGWTAPVLIDPEGTIIAGHGRVMAATAIYADQGTIRMATGEQIPPGCVPVIVARGWSQSQIRAYVIADNRLAEKAGWDWKILRVELAELDFAAFDFSLVGFTPKDIEELTPDESSKAKKKAEPEATPLKCKCPSCGTEFEAGEMTVTKAKKQRAPKGPVEGPLH